MIRRRALLKMLFVVFTLLILGACAPKQIRLYDVSTDAIRIEVSQAALVQKGKPYRSGAKGPDAFDCSGLVHYVFKQNRVPLPVTAEAQGRAGYEINRDNIQPGDLVLFRIGSDWHVGIMVGRNEFVHASKSRGVVVDNVDGDYWQKRLVGFRSIL